MRSVLFVLASIVISASAFAGNIKCQVDNILVGSGSAKAVVANVIAGSQPSNLRPVSYEGSTVSATLFKGDNSEQQRVLQMTIDDIVSSIRHVSESSGYELNKGNLRFQCWFE